MNLLFLSMTFPDAAAASRGTYNLALCAALAEQHHVSVIAPRSWLERIRRRSFATPAECTAHDIDCRYPTFWYPPGILRSKLGRCLWQSVRSSVRKVADECTFDAVLSYWAHPDGEAGLRAAQMLGVPHAVIVGGSDVLLLPRDRARRDCVRRVLNESDTVLTVSDGLRDAVIELGVDPVRVHTVYQGIDTTLFTPGDQHAARQRLQLPPDGSLLVWVGRMVDVKGLDVLLGACSELQRRGREVDLYLIGDGPLRRTVAAQIQSHGLSHSVHCIGPLPPAQVADWYRAADATVLSSWSEGLPNVLRESLACGTPFVATDVGSIGEIASPDVARLCPPGDPRSLAAAIDALLDGEYRAAAARYQPRTWRDCADEVTSILDCSAGPSRFRHRVTPIEAACP
jgi:teichuronic acid biosynthesis glycosyltransferase TuaC